MGRCGAKRNPYSVQLLGPNKPSPGTRNRSATCNMQESISKTNPPLQPSPSRGFGSIPKLRDCRNFHNGPMRSHFTRSMGKLICIGLVLSFAFYTCKAQDSAASSFEIG